MYRTGVPLPSRCCILYILFQQIQVLSILNMLHTLRFSLQNAVYFIMLPIWVHVLFIFYVHPSYIQDGCTATLQMLHFIYTFSTNISTEYFKHAVHSPFFSSKCRLFHNATVLGSCIIHILRTECAKIQM
jgi:hypothetical protein